MNKLILNNEPAIRLGIFIAMIALMAAWEFIAPKRGRAFSRLARWPSNFAIVFLNTAVLRILFPVAAVATAIVAAERGWGFLNLAGLPSWAAVIIAVVLLDLVIYLQHVIFHASPVLWRLHRMHHADLDFDFTTGARFHPIEVALSMLIKLAAVALIGAPAVAVIIFEVVLNAAAMFNHGNVRIPIAVDKVLRLIIVTPDMHRVHHSIVATETNSNFGFNLPWWDRIFRTYRDQPAAGHEKMTIGLDSFRGPRQLRLHWMLVQPFLGGGGNFEPGAYKTLTRIVFAAVLIGAIAWAFMHRQELDVTALEAHLAGFGALAPLIFIAAFAVGAVLILPGVIFTLAGGALFGPFFGLAFNLTGATIGATIAFLISRHLGADWVEHKSGPRLKRLMEGVDAEGWRFVAFTRLVPLFPFNLLNYALGLTGIRTLPYVVTTAICMIPGGLAYTYLGYAGREALAGGESAVQNALLAIGLLVAVAFLPRLVRAFRKPNSISVGDLASRLKSEDAITVLDVRGADDFTGELGHVPGALNMPLAGLSEHLDALKAKAGGTVAVICLTDKRSRAAISLLEKQGFTDLLLVDGGMKEWNRLGFAVNREGNAGNKGTAKESSL